MKKGLLAFVVLVGMVGIAKADETAYFSYGPLSLNIPFKTADVVYLYDGVNQRSLTGGETTIFTVFNKVRGTVGVVTTIQNAQGAPFVGADVDLGNALDRFLNLGPIQIGGFGGRDFREDRWIGGLKASLLLWS